MKTKPKPDQAVFWLRLIALDIGFPKDIRIFRGTFPRMGNYKSNCFATFEKAQKARKAIIEILRS